MGRLSRRTTRLGLSMAVLWLSGNGAAPTAAAATAATPTDADLAYHWAPIHHQDTDDTDPDADYLSAVDFDGNWSTDDNWQNQDDDPNRLGGIVYYSVVETRTHWFVLYAFYHPRDWCDTRFCRNAFSPQHHENDLEGMLLAVRRDGSGHGALEAMVTVAHRDFHSYVAPGASYTDGREDDEGQILLSSHDGNPGRPATFQEAKGHGTYAWDGKEFPGGDGVVYVPSRTTSAAPSDGNDRSVEYRLVSLLAPKGMWARRNEPETFASFGVFRGDDGKPNAANAPWKWDDHDDGGELPGGELAVDPAKLVDLYFDGVGEFDRDYLRNDYRL